MLATVHRICGRIMHLQPSLRSQWDKGWKNNSQFASPSIRRPTLKGEDIIMKSNGAGKRSFCYITDAVIGYFYILLKGVIGEAYNVCNESQYVSIADLADKLACLYPERNITVVKKKRDKNENYSENILAVGQDTIPSSDKLKKLGWKPVIDIKTGFDRVIKYIESEY